ncbi:MAG TPA: DUF983 domain-containing protein [Bacteroidia bacterium]|nr:DUF983 domain-containing protein [Bacteroidia bacterium]
MEGFLNSVINSKCPRCNLDNLYVDNNPYHLSKLGQMKTKCEKCGQAYEPETGFYYGAMYVSYALSVGAMFIPGYLLYLLFDVSFVVLLGFVLTVYILAFPLFFRLARNIWLNIFVKYDRSLRHELEQKISPQH